MLLAWENLWATDHVVVFLESPCLWRGDGNMAAPAVLHSLLWLQIALHSRHPFQVVLNSLLTKAIGEHGMESSTREQSFVTTMVPTQERRTGKTRRTNSRNGMDLQMFARLELHGVAVLNCQIGLRVSPDGAGRWFRARWW